MCSNSLRLGMIAALATGQRCSTCTAWTPERPRLLMSDDPISIKGIREGLLLTIRPDGGDWPDLAVKVQQRIDEQRAFYKGARLALDVGSRPVRHHELDSLKAVLFGREITLWAVVSSSDTTLQAARSLKLETSLITHNEEQLETKPATPEEGGTPALCINRTLRTGRRLRNKCSELILGDVT